MGFQAGLFMDSDMLTTCLLIWSVPRIITLSVNGGDGFIHFKTLDVVTDTNN